MSRMLVIGAQGRVGARLADTFRAFGAYCICRLTAWRSQSGFQLTYGENKAGLVDEKYRKEEIDFEWLCQFAKGLELLDDYDLEQLDTNGLNKRSTIYPEMETIMYF